MEIKKLFIFALILRLLIAPIFYHPDIKSQHFHFQFLSQGHLNIYKFINDNKQNLPYRDTFNYPPLAYLLFGTEQILLKPFLPADFTTWINDWGGAQNSYPNLFYFMLILKIPYIAIDLLIGYLLYKLYGKKVLSFWLFNPLSLYLIYVLANFDIVPVFLSLLSFYWLKNSRSVLAFITLGTAIALKAYPLLLFPFFLFYKPQNIKTLFVNTLSLVLPILLSIFPFIFDPNFFQAFSGSGLTQKIIETKLFSVPLYPAIYFIVFLQYFISKDKNLERSFLYLFLAFISFVNFHPQWLLWFFPFTLPLIVENKRNLIIFFVISVLVLLYVFLVNDRYLVFGHLMPVDSAFIQLNNPYTIILNKFGLIPEKIQSYLKIVLLLCSAIFVWNSYEHKKH